MKISVKDKFWIGKRSGFILLSFVCLVVGYTLPALALLIFTCQKIFHEFVHAGTAKLLGGEVTEISLSGNSYIDFDISSEKAGLVYLAGFIFDGICITSAALLLVWTHGAIFPAFGYMVILAGLLYSLWPQESDFNQWRYWREKSKSLL